MTQNKDDRESVVQRIERTQCWDMLVIGGGITGVGVAREAARQGLSLSLIHI